MKKSKFTEAQILKILQEADQGHLTISHLCKKHGISDQSFYRWKKMYAGMSQSEVVKLRQLEKENSRLKKLVAERDLEIDAMKEVLSKNL